MAIKYILTQGSEWETETQDNLLLLNSHTLAIALLSPKPYISVCVCVCKMKRQLIFNHTYFILIHTCIIFLSTLLWKSC